MTSTLLLALALAIALPACGGDEPCCPHGEHNVDAPPGTVEGVKALLADFQAPGADLAALSAALRPTQADFEAVFTPDAAPKAMAGYAKPWDEGQIGLDPGVPADADILVWTATAEELKAKTGDASEFPGGYADVAQHLKDGVTWYRVKFVKPGGTRGNTITGLVHVNGHWVIFPKPWRVLR